MLQMASGENAHAGFVAEMRIQGFSPLSAIAASFLHSLARSQLENTSLEVWMLNGEKEVFVPVLPCQGLST